MNDFLGRYVELAPKILSYVESINIFVAPLQTGWYERKLIEGAIASRVKAQPDEVSRFYPRDNRTYNPQANEKGILVQIESSVKIEGLPSELLL